MMGRKGQELKRNKRGEVQGAATVDEVTACGDKRWIEKENRTKL